MPLVVVSYFTNRHLLGLFQSVDQTMRRESSAHVSGYQGMISTLEEALRGNQWQTVDSLELSFAVGDFDANIIFACRKLVSEYVLDNRDKDFNGLSLQDSILPSYGLR
jgi:hypothetical protein